MIWILISWSVYNFLGCFMHTLSGSAAFPRLTSVEAFINVLIFTWAVNQTLNQG